MSKTEKETKIKPKKDKEKTKRSQSKPPTRVVIRHLPPTMSEEEFLKQIDPMPEHDDYYFCEADWSLGYDATCRAYINFKNYDDVFLFRDRFDGYVFVDSKGFEYLAIVEFAPFQCFTEVKTRRRDQLMNTIEQDEHFQQFVEKLTQEREAASKGDVKLEFNLDNRKKEEVTTTPLLEYLASKKEKRREERKRQREEEREKRRQKEAQTKMIWTNKSGKKEKVVDNEKQRQQGSQVSLNSNQSAPSEEAAKKSGSRRAARSQRRREEYEQRKKEKRNAAKAGEVCGDSEDKRENKENKSIGDLESKIVAEDRSSEQKGSRRNSLTGEGGGGKNSLSGSGNASGGTGRRHSEKRERNRNRKESKRENINEETETPKQIFKKTDIVSPSVRNFFETFAAKDLPREQPAPSVEKEKQMPSNAKQKMDTDIDQVKEKLEVLSLKNENETRKEAVVSSPEHAYEDSQKRELQSQRSSEERRIRNKDRPSIAIYQPKPRLRLSEEVSKDPTNSPQLSSDGETKRKDEKQRLKKISRRHEHSIGPLSSDGEGKRKDEKHRSKKMVRRAEKRSEKSSDKSDKLNSSNEENHKSSGELANEVAECLEASTSKAAASEEIKND